jgi:hypothetical protein
MSLRTKLDDLRARHDQLLHDREPWEPAWEDVAKHFLPHKCRFTDKEDVTRTNGGILRESPLNAAGIYALRDLAAGLHGGMTSPARPWFRLTLPDRDLARHRTVREWLDGNTKAMRNVFARSNFYRAAHEIYGELGGFGSGFMFIKPHSLDQTRLIFSPLTVGEYSMADNEIGDIDTISRVLVMTARQIVREFGYDNCSDDVKRAFDLASSTMTRFKVVHMVYPRNDRDPNKLDAKNKRFASIWFEEGSRDKLLRESGFDVFPGVGVRWSVTGHDVYGVSPAMDTLGDVKMLQNMEYTHLKGLHKMADPPTGSGSDMDLLDLHPGGQNPGVVTTTGAMGVYPIYQVDPRTQELQLKINDVKQQIREGMYNDLFSMLSRSPVSNMTATQVAEMQEEKLIMLGPVIERLNDEFFMPLIDITFAHMLANEMVPPPPEEIQGMPIKVEFVSLLAQAQKQLGTVAVERYMNFVVNYGQAIPELMDSPEIDRVGDGYAEMLGVDVEMVASQADRDAKRQQRAQMQQQAVMAEQAQQAATAAHSAGNTPTKGGESSLLDDVMESLTGAAANTVAGDIV